LSLDQKELPDHVMKCLKFLQSDAIFLMLSSLTGLKLHDLAEVSDSEGEEEEEGKNTHKGKMIPTNTSIWIKSTQTLE
jgi:hypothetical protein